MASCGTVYVRAVPGRVLDKHWPSTALDFLPGDSDRDCWTEDGLFSYGAPAARCVVVACVTGEPTRENSGDRCANFNAA